MLAADSTLISTLKKLRGVGHRGAAWAAPWGVSRAVGIALGVAADAAYGDPERHHPVAIFGEFATRVERLVYADSTLAGAVFIAATTLPVGIVGIGIERLTRTCPVAHAATTAMVTWTVLGAGRLAAEGRTMANRLDTDNLPAARAQLPNLCGRDPRNMDASELARATVESMAENTADAAVASLFWGAIAGIPGMLIHRAVNTLDAMVGYRNDRYGRFGTASAQTDDTLCYLPARITGSVACTVAPTVGGDPRQTWQIMRRDASNHPSPNGGWCESAWAGALGVQLGGTNVYDSRVEERGLLGEGPRPDADAVRNAARLVGVVTTVVTGAVVVGLVAAGRESVSWGRR